MDFLLEIVRETRATLGNPSYGALLPATHPPARPSLVAAIVRDRARGAILVEHKRVSPGAPDPILPPQTMDEFVRGGEAAEITGYSCLATHARFDGSPRDVAELSARTGRPVLFKDFVIDPIQIEAAARAGASAILLIARLAGPPYEIPLAELASESHRLGLEVLLEFHDRTELRLTEDLAADMYGVNTRDLTSLLLDRPVAAETLRATSHLRPMLGLSGVAGPEEARQFWALGTDGILVGTAFARAKDPLAFVSSLRRPAGGVA